MAEKNEVTKFLNWCRKTDGVQARKRHGSVYGHRGEPDVSCVVLGIACFFEFKWGANKASILQEKDLDAWANAGAISMVVYSANEAMMAVMAILQMRDEFEDVVGRVRERAQQKREP